MRKRPKKVVVYEKYGHFFMVYEILTEKLIPPGGKTERQRQSSILNISKARLYFEFYLSIEAISSISRIFLLR